MRIKLCSVMVNDQDKAFDFYTRVLGFIARTEIPMGEYRWLTVVSPDAPEEVELVLEPTAFDATKTYQKALFDAGISATAFEVADIDKDYARLRELGVVFRGPPSQAGPTRIAVFEDTCGNLIQIYQAVA